MGASSRVQTLVRSATAALLTAWSGLAHGQPLVRPTPTDAVAFIRVVGDVLVDVTEDWEGPERIENVEVATGSGFVVSPSGLVVTNEHVVRGGRTVERIRGRRVAVTVEVQAVEVAVGGGGRFGRFPAWVAASDEDLDLAILQVTGPELPFIPFGDSDALEPGDRVEVLGFPFGRQVEVGRDIGAQGVPDPSVTVGSLSAARPDEEGRRRYLQTDASVNPGSSGGPIVNEDQRVVGVVKMKLSAGEQTQGAGFGIPVNMLKDFLESHGLLDQVPGMRLHPGFLHEMDWKGIRIEMPDGLADEWLGRLRVDTANEGDRISLRIDRVATRGGVGRLEEVMLGPRGLPGWAPAPATIDGRRVRGRPSRLLGTASGRSGDGTPFQVEYAVLDLGREQVVARYLGSPLDVAFNLGLLRRSLESLAAVPLLTEEVRGAPTLTFERSGLDVPVWPSGWTTEPTSRSSCTSLPPPRAGVAASPTGDFTVVFRALTFDSFQHSRDELAHACGAGPGTVGPTWARASDRLGVSLAHWGVLVERDGDVLLLEAEAPEHKLRVMRSAFVQWVGEVAALP